MTPSPTNRTCAVARWPRGRWQRLHTWAPRWGIILLLTLTGSSHRAVAAPAAAEVDPAANQLLAAQGLFERGLYKQAAEEFARFLKDHPAHAKAMVARYALAVAHFRLNRHDDAIGLLTEVLKEPSFEQREDALAVLGHCHIAKGDHPRALATLEELLTRHPQGKHAETAAASRVHVLFQSQRKKEALDAARAFGEKYPQSGHRAAALYIFALSCHGLGRHDDAVVAAQTLLKDYPALPYRYDVSLLLGQALESAGKTEAAINQYQKTVKLAAPDHLAEARFSLGSALCKAQQHEAAVKEFAAVLSDDPKSAVAPAARLQLGMARLALANRDDARRILEAVVSADPDRAPMARYGLAQADLAESKFDAALAKLDQLITLKTPPVDRWRLRFDRSAALMGLERFDEAARGFEALRKEHGTELAPQLNGDAIYRQAYCLHRLKQYGESHALAAQVPQSSAAVRPTRELDAENLFLLGQYEPAEQAFGTLAAETQNAVQRDRFRLRMGQSAYFARQYERAIGHLSSLGVPPRTGRAAKNPKLAAVDLARHPELAPGVLLLGDALLQVNRPKEAAEALAEYVAAVKQSKELPEARYKLAVAQLRGGDEKSAEQTLAGLIGGDPSPWVIRGLFEYGQIRFARKDYAKAGEALAKVAAAKDAPDELAAPASFMLAWIEWENKKYESAAAAFATFVQQHPGHERAGDALYYQGVALREGGKGAEAARVFEQYVRASPQGPHAQAARQMIASSLTRAGKPEEAVKMLQALAADAKTRSDSVLYELAWAHRTARDDKAAIEAYRQLIVQFPQGKMVEAARAELGDLLYQQGEYAQAAQLLEKAADSKELNAQTLSVARYRLGWAYDKLKEPRKAAPAFARFVKEHPDDPLVPSALYQSAEALVAAGRLAEARDALAQVVSRHPGSDIHNVALLRLGQVQAEVSDFEGSGRSYQEFLRKYPKDKFEYLAQFGMGWSLEKRKQHEPARQWYLRVTRSHNGPTAARAQFQIGETWFAEGKYEEAVKSLLAVEDVYGDPEWSPRALLEAGRALEQLNQPDAARRQYEALVKKYRSAPEAALAEKQLKGLK